MKIDNALIAEAQRLAGGMHVHTVNTLIGNYTAYAEMLGYNPNNSKAIEKFLSFERQLRKYVAKRKMAILKIKILRDKKENFPGIEVLYRDRVASDFVGD